MLKVKLLLSLYNLMRYKDLTVSYRVLPSFLILNILINILIFKLLNILLNNLVNRNIKDLNIACAASRNN